MLELRAGGRKAVIGMIHLQPLPGTPFEAGGTLERTIATAVASAVALQEGGADGCLVQTVDRVYSVEDEIDPARTAALTLVVRAVADATDGRLPIGVQVMRNALRGSLAVAKVAGGSFIRAGALVGMTLTAHGMVVADPLQVMEYRRRIEADDIGIVADVESMHFSWFGGKAVGEVARAAMGVGASAVSLGHPDREATLAAIEAVRVAVPDAPIVLAGYTNHENARHLLARADGAFVGTCLERGGWGGTVDRALVESYVEIARSVEGLAT